MMRIRLGRVITLLALPMVCLGDISTSVSVNGNLGGVSAGCSTNGSSTASCNQTSNGVSEGPFPPVGLPVTVSVSGSADASYGALFASVNATLSDDGNERGTATASFSDILTVLGGVGTGYISYLFDGSITSFTDVLPSGANGFTIQQGGLSPGGFGVHGIADILNEPFNYQTPFYAFTFGVPFDLDVGAKAFFSGNGDGFGQGTVGVDLYSIMVVNQNGDPIPFTITSQSGAVYPTPEPSSLLLSGTLVALMGAMLRKRRRAGAPEG